MRFRNRVFRQAERGEGDLRHFRPAVPVVVTQWQEWVTAHPDTAVLDIATGIYSSLTYFPESNPRAIYYDYFNSADTMFPVWRRSSLLDTKTVVLGLRVQGEAKAYPLDKLAESVVVNDELGGLALVIVTDTEAGAARAYHRRGSRFEADPAEPGKQQVEGNRRGPIERRKSFPAPGAASRSHGLLVWLVRVVPAHATLRRAIGWMVSYSLGINRQG